MLLDKKFTKASDEIMIEEAFLENSLDKFDLIVFESIVKKVIVGRYRM